MADKQWKAGRFLYRLGKCRLKSQWGWRKIVKSAGTKRRTLSSPVRRLCASGTTVQSSLAGAKAEATNSVRPASPLLFKHSEALTQEQGDMFQNVRRIVVITEKSWKLPKYIRTERHRREIKINELGLNASMWGKRKSFRKHSVFIEDDWGRDTNLKTFQRI